MRYVLITLLMLSSAFVGRLNGQSGDAERKMVRLIKTNGQAVLTVRPDRARIDVGVETQAASSQSAVEENRTRANAVIESVRTLLGQDADIRTISYSVSPNYRYPKEGGEPTITGYTATNIVRVTLDDLTKIGSVIDTATKVGTNRINGLHFTLKDDTAVKKKALAEAAADARAKADALASALGVRLGDVVEAAESSPVVIPVRDVAFARAEATQTPIEPGTIEIRASVALSMAILK